MTKFFNFSPGEKVVHKDFGEGVVLALVDEKLVRVFFQESEKVVSPDSISPLKNWAESIVENCRASESRRLKNFITFESYSLPLSDNIASLTSAQIDLLPHQVVLTHRIASNSPRRYLIADEVGLGKTIEAALILRELSSRGELNRALMVVPAGLVNNWHRELNEVFNLSFEVFGSSGDVTDRRSNAFQKHNFLIASIDTLKRPSRLKKIIDSPKWDLVVFDEAHHLTAYKNGGKVKRTENYKFAEALRDHCRDMVLLSATPHQGDHFRFWMLVRLLEPSLFISEDEMLEKRYRLNNIIFRRTKADACRPDGSTLFARRLVHTESFLMSDEEKVFYNSLSDYITDGFDLAKKQGGKGQALGFVMTIFQKIAASSFAAIERTLRRRLIGLTVHEALVHDENLRVTERDDALNEAKEIIRKEFNIDDGRTGDVEVDRILLDIKGKLIKKMDDDYLYLISSEYESESKTQASEDTFTTSVALALPEERLRIKNLLSCLPKSRETKIEKLLFALRALWKQNPEEKIVIFATYLGTVEMIGKEILKEFPTQEIVVLKGGDHASKLAAERRFRRPDGAKVIICTAAGREGLNLQFARVLFNFDLPWNPMDLEQRIGRIHRYGQKDTAQVYNLVLSDTIEGKIFLLLDEKLKEIAKAVGKLDEKGEVAEDLKAAVLGQLTEKISYDRLYSEALKDPELKRTQIELEAALKNAEEAKNVVTDLFQDLDKFNIEEYEPLANVDAELNRIESLLSKASSIEDFEYSRESATTFSIKYNGTSKVFTKDRQKSIDEENLDLIGLDHPLVEEIFNKYKSLDASEIAFSVDGKGKTGAASSWLVEGLGANGETIKKVINLVVDFEGKRLTELEKNYHDLFNYADKEAEKKQLSASFLHDTIEPLLHREISHRNFIKSDAGYSTKLISWIYLV